MRRTQMSTAAGQSLRRLRRRWRHAQLRARHLVRLRVAVGVSAAVWHKGGDPPGSPCPRRRHLVAWHSALDLYLLLVQRLQRPRQQHCLHRLLVRKRHEPKSPRLQQPPSNPAARQRSSETIRGLLFPALKTILLLFTASPSFPGSDYWQGQHVSCPGLACECGKFS